MSNALIKNHVSLFSLAEEAVLREFRLIDAAGRLVEAYLERPENKPLGHGFKLNLDVIQRLSAADTTPDKRWLRWIFFQAGGGQRAKDASTKALDQTRDRFIAERVNGYEDAVTKTVFEPVSKTEAESRWNALESRWSDQLTSADQDVVEHLHVFGYYRAWPGKDKLYSRVADAVTKILSLSKEIKLMNLECAETSGKSIASEPSDFATIDDLEGAVKAVERYFASKGARDDIKVDFIYEDDNVRVICPLTYAASVRYGFDNWPFSNRTIFEEVLESDNSFRDAWKSTTSRSVLVFWYWKVPMPSWISRKNNEFCRYELVNLAMEMPRTPSVGSEPQFHDEELATNLSCNQLKAMILDEPVRLPDPQDEELPVKRGPNAYSSQYEADVRIQSLGRAFAAINCWFNTFDLKRIKSDALGLDVVAAP